MDGAVNGIQENVLHNPTLQEDNRSQYSPVSSFFFSSLIFFLPLIHSQGQLQAELCNFVFCYTLLKQIILKSSFW